MHKYHILRFFTQITRYFFFVATFLSLTHCASYPSSSDNENNLLSALRQRNSPDVHSVLIESTRYATFELQNRENNLYRVTLFPTYPQMMYSAEKQGHSIGGQINTAQFIKSWDTIASPSFDQVPPTIDIEGFSLTKKRVALHGHADHPQYEATNQKVSFDVTLDEDSVSNRAPIFNLRHVALFIRPTLAATKRSS